MGRGGARAMASTRARQGLWLEHKARARDKATEKTRARAMDISIGHFGLTCGSTKPPEELELKLGEEHELTSLI